MAKDARGREPTDWYNESMAAFYKKMDYVRKGIEELKANFDSLMNAVGGAESNIFCAAAALKEREKGD